MSNLAVAIRKSLGPKHETPSVREEAPCRAFSTTGVEASGEEVAEKLNCFLLGHLRCQVLPYAMSCIKRLKSLPPQFSMFEASDDEAENAVDPLGGNSLPAGFQFLGKLCECKSRDCYRQFKSRADAVKQKQLEFRAT